MNVNDDVQVVNEEEEDDDSTQSLHEDDVSNQDYGYGWIDDYGYSGESFGKPTLPEGVYENEKISDLMSLISSFSYEDQGYILQLDPSRYEHVDNFITHVCQHKKTVYDYIEVSYCTTCDCGAISNYTFFDSLFKRPLEAIIDIVDYMILKEYIGRSDPEFEKIIIKQITEYKYQIEELQKFMYFTKNYINPVTINNYLELDGGCTYYSFLDRVINTGIFLPDDYVDELFEFFDSIGFEYTKPEYTNLMYFAVDSRNSKCVKKLVERGLSVNLPIIYEHLFERVRIDIISFQTFTELNMDRINSYTDKISVPDEDKLKCKFYEYLLKRPDLIKEFFTDDNDESRTRIIQKKVIEIIKTFGLKDYHDFIYDFNHNDNRMNKFIREKELADFVNLFQTLDMGSLKFDKVLTQKFNKTDQYLLLKPMTLYELYIHGSFPIQLMYPDLHQKLKFVLIKSIIYPVLEFKVIPTDVINLIISYV